MEEQDPLRDKIRDFKEKHPDPDPPVDAVFVLDALDYASEGSCVWASIDCLVEGDWRGEAPMYGVTGVRIGEDGKLVLRASSSGIAKEAAVLLDLVRECLNGVSGAGMKVCFEKGEQLFEITDVFGHGTIHDKMAGLPMDIVLAKTSDGVSKKPLEKKEE